MMKQTSYQAKTPDKNGIIPYTDEENETWSILYHRQRALLPGRACEDYIAGLERLELSTDRIPQPGEVSERLLDFTGWQVEPVPALINFTDFFQLLSEKKFPAASFIRRREDLDYLQEPDIFHEIFGHCPLLTYPGFADFTQNYGKYGLAASKKDRPMLARLYWFTVEFGLLRENGQLRSYGAGINSSPGELQYALDSDIPERLPFDPLDALRTPYRIDIYQPVYFVLNHPKELYHLAEVNLQELIDQARKLGEFPPKFDKEAS